MKPNIQLSENSTFWKQLTKCWYDETNKQKPDQNTQAEKLLSLLLFAVSHFQRRKHLIINLLIVICPSLHILP